MTLRDVAGSGARRATLEALRDKLAAEIDSAATQYVAVLSRQLQSVMSEIASLPDGREVTPLDELKAKRSARRKGAPNQKRSDAGVKRGPRRRAAGGSGGAGS